MRPAGLLALRPTRRAAWCLGLSLALLACSLLLLPTVPYHGTRRETSSSSSSSSSAPAKNGRASLAARLALTRAPSIFSSSSASWRVAAPIEPAPADACPPGPCSGHGRCVRQVALPTVYPAPTAGAVPSELSFCRCDAGWASPRCERRTCARSCSGNGVCLFNGTCACFAGWRGAACRQPAEGAGGDDDNSPTADAACPVGDERTGVPCSAHGTCNSEAGGGASCICDEGWSGDACDQPVQSEYERARRGAGTLDRCASPADAAGEDNDRDDRDANAALDALPLAEAGRQWISIRANVSMAGGDGDGASTEQAQRARALPWLCVAFDLAARLEAPAPIGQPDIVLRQWTQWTSASAPLWRLVAAVSAPLQADLFAQLRDYTTRILPSKIGAERVHDVQIALAATTAGNASLSAPSTALGGAHNGARSLSALELVGVIALGVLGFLAIVGGGVCGSVAVVRYRRRRQRAAQQADEADEADDRGGEPRPDPERRSSTPGKSAPAGAAGEGEPNGNGLQWHGNCYSPERVNLEELVTVPLDDHSPHRARRPRYRGQHAARWEL